MTPRFIFPFPKFDLESSDVIHFSEHGLTCCNFTVLRHTFIYYSEKHGKGRSVASNVEIRNQKFFF
jgi:hypothetical protein